MFGRRRSPVSAEASAWTESSLNWLLEQFGEQMLRGRVIRRADLAARIGPARGAAMVGIVVDVAAERMGVDRRALTIEVVDDGKPIGASELPAVSEFSGAAGEYDAHDGSPRITVGKSQLDKPLSVVAVIAHELCHVRLLGESRLARDRRDMEQLTDLATVFFGFGIFNANAAFEVYSDGKWRERTTLGYLGEAMFGYALACYAELRDEPSPAWRADLDTNPRVYMQRGVRYLASRR